MKNKAIYILSTLLMIFCGCSAEWLDDDLSLVQTVENTILETSAASVFTDAAEDTIEFKCSITTTEQISVENEEVEKVIAFVKNEGIAWGDFYDFDKDGIPEITSEQGGHAIYEVNYVVYKLIDGEYKEFGNIIAHKRNDGNKFTLYRDKKTGEYFYIGDEYFSGWGIISNNTYKYIFTDDKIIKTKIAEYYCDYTDEGKCKVNARFLINDTPELNYQSLDDLYIGIREYLSKFEKVEEPNIKPEWNSIDDDIEVKLKNKLQEYYD